MTDEDRRTSSSGASASPTSSPERRHGPPSCRRSSSARAPSGCAFVAEHGPAVVAVAGVTSYRAAFGCRSAVLGRQPESLAAPSCGSCRTRADSTPTRRSTPSPPPTAAPPSPPASFEIIRVLEVRRPHTGHSDGPKHSGGSAWRAFGFSAVGEVPVDGRAEAVLERHPRPPPEQVLGAVWRRRGDEADRLAASDPSAAHLRSPPDGRSSRPSRGPSPPDRCRG